jgi:hypothetical protein
MIFNSSFKGKVVERKLKSHQSEPVAVIRIPRITKFSA